MTVHTHTYLILNLYTLYSHSNTGLCVCVPCLCKQGYYKWIAGYKIGVDDHEV